MGDSTHGRGLDQRDLTFSGGEADYPVFVTPIDRHARRGELLSAGTLRASATNNSRHHIVVKNPAGSGKIVELLKFNASAGASHDRRYFTPGTVEPDGTLSARNWNQADGVDQHQAVVTYGTIDSAIEQDEFPAPAIVSTGKKSPGPLADEQFAVKLGEGDTFGVEVEMGGADDVAISVTFAEFDA